MEKGWAPILAPLGYLNITNPNPTSSYDKRIVVPNKETAPFITRSFQMYATRQYSVVDIKRYLDRNGVKGKLGKAVQFSVVFHMLRNTFYYGLMRWSGKEQIGKHTPLIDKPTFDLVQKILTEKGDYQIRRRKHNFLLRGIVFCKGCSRRYVAEFHYHEKYKTGGGKIGMYHCSGLGKRGTGCGEKYLTLTNLEEQIQNQVAKLEFKPEFIEAVKRNVFHVYQASVDRVKQSKKAAFNRKEAIEQKRAKLEEEMLAGNVSGESFKRLNSSLESDLVKVQIELMDIDKVKTIDVDIIQEVLDLTQNIVRAYNNADTDRKRSYLHFFFEKIWLKDQKIVKIDYTPVLNVLNEARLGILVSDLLPREDSNL